MARRRVLEKDAATVTLKQMRTRLGMIQDEVAQALGVQRDTVSKMESGMIKVKVLYIPILAQLYGVDVATIVRACVPQNGHREMPQRPEQSWEEKVRAVLKDLVRLEKETPRG